MTPESKRNIPTVKQLLTSLAMFGIVATGEVPKIEKAQAQQAQTIEKDDYKEAKNVMNRVILIMDQQKGRVPLLKKGVKDEEICKFNREWLHSEVTIGGETFTTKKELEKVWEYIQKNENDLPENVRKSFTEFLQISSQIKKDWGKLNRLFSPIRGTIGRAMVETKSEMDEHIKEYFKKGPKKVEAPKEGEPECSLLFRQVFESIETGKGEVIPQAQEISAKFIKGVAELIINKIEKGTAEEKKEAGQMAIILGKIIFSATR